MPWDWKSIKKATGQILSEVDSKFENTITSTTDYVRKGITPEVSFPEKVVQGKTLSTKIILKILPPDYLEIPNILRSFASN